MKTIQELDIQKQKAEKRLRQIKNAIDDLEQAQILPEMRKKYEGKYFKYENRYDSKESWWMYFYVSSVKTRWRVKGIEFQKTCTGEITVSVKDNLCLSLLDIECDKSEFDRNINSTINILKKYIL
jgi:hypothetical protein